MNKLIRWGQPNQTNVVRPGEWIVPNKSSGGSGPVEPPAAFDALTYDPVTYEMLGIKTGTGDLTVAASTTSYAPDKDGVYQQFDVNTPVWSGGRVTLTGGAGSLVDKVYADDGSGNLLPDIPYLQYYPAATNQVLWSRDLTNAAWTDGGTPPSAITYDQIGLTGEANTATFIEDNSVVDRPSWRTASVVSSLTGCYAFYVKKDSDQTRFPEFQASSNTGSNGIKVLLNTQTGAFNIRSNVDGGAVEIVDVGLWWKVLIQTATATGYHPWLVPAQSTDFVNTDNAATGSIIVGNVEFHEGKTIAQVRGLAPIFTEAAAITQVATQYSFDAVNNGANTDGCYFMECILSMSNSDIATQNNILSMDNSTRAVLTLASSSGGRFVTFDVNGSASTRNVVIPSGQFNKVATVYSTTDNIHSANLNGVYNASNVFAGYRINSAYMYIGRNTSGVYLFEAPAKIRNLKRYDIDSYQEGKDIIDGLMIDYVTGDSFNDYLTDDSSNRLTI